MRQGNGSDLLGASDPRNSTIGVIYVAPNDDRESVLTAIWTQEKLGRKQIAIVLPNQNKAFQRPVDFDGLKNMRRKLQASLIIVASHGSSPAEFARQRHFPLFTSLENYGQSLRDENEASRATKRGGWFGARNRKPPVDTAAAKNIEDVPTGTLPASNESEKRIQPAPDTVDEGVEEQHASPHVGAAAMGMGIGAGALAADQLMHRPDDEVAAMPPLMQHEDAANDDLALSASSPQVVDSSPTGGGPAQDEMQPLPPGQMPTEEGPADIITFPQPTRARDADNVPLPPAKSEPEEEPVPVVVPPPTPIARRSSGKTAAVGAAGVGVGAGMAGRNVTPGGVPPTGGNAGGGGGGGGGGAAGGPRRRRSGWQLLLLALVALLLLSLLLCGSIALAAPGTLGSFGTSVSHVLSGGPPSATVTITPKSTDVLNTYVITGVTTGTPDSAKRQVRARILTPVTETQAKTVPATGVKNYPAQSATGTLTFYNGSNTDLVVKANTFAISVNGVQIKINADVDVPAASAGAFGVNNVGAYADPPGASGNIAAGTIGQFCCGSGSLSVKNLAPFMGGQDAYTRTVVQQSDIDNAANPLKAPLKQAALSSPNLKKQPGEQYLPNQPQCSTMVNPDHAVGQQAPNVTVTVNVTCTGEVYDQDGAQVIATNLLKSEAPKIAGPGYALTGNVVTMVTQITVNSKGIVTLLVKAEGIWVYQFNTAYKMQLAKLIAGMSQSKANTLLLGQAGVEKVDGINIAGGGNTLPTNASQITIVVQNVPGLQGTATPTGSPGSGTPTSTTSSPVPRPSPSKVPGK